MAKGYPTSPFRCPRCGHFHSSYAERKNPNWQKCYHCGFQRNNENQQPNTA